LPRSVETPRPPLTRHRILSAGVDLADREGIESLSMRTLGTVLGVQAMSLYNHVANKEDLLDGMVDLIFAEIALSNPPTGDWKTIIRQRAISARTVLSEHPWAVALMDSSSLPGPATMGHFEKVLGCLRQAGFSVERTLHAYAVIFAYVYGFVLAFQDDDHISNAKQIIEAVGPAEFPYAIEATTYYLQRGDDQTQDFLGGLDLILDGIERTLAGIQPNSKRPSREDRKSSASRRA